MKIIALLLLTPALAFMQIKDESVNWKLVSLGNKFPEGPVWNADKEELYVSNCYGNWITRIKDDKADTLLLADSVNYMQTNGMAYFNGNVYACEFGLGAIIKIADGEAEVEIDGYKGLPFNRPNDISFDANGNFYFSDPKSYGKDKLDGRLFYYNLKNKKLMLVADSLAFPNGLGVSPVDNRLYLSESAKNRIVSFKILPDGSLTDKKVFVELPGGDPDGMNFDSNGNLWVAHFGTGRVFVISPEGNILHRIITPGKKPSNIEFAGKDLTDVYLTEDETNCVYKFNFGVQGYSLNTHAFPTSK